MAQEKVKREASLRETREKSGTKVNTQAADPMVDTKVVETIKEGKMIYRRQ